MSGKYALIIGNTEYLDPGLAQLTAPGKDTEDLARVLKDKEICAFDEVNSLLNQPEHIVRRTIDDFFDQKKPDDLLVLYFSGHGVRDELGSLYLAVKNTIRGRLRSTAIKSDYIREAMDQSRSKRQILILDCCNSGAFSQGAKADVGGAMGMVSAFQGYGRYVLTASDATQFAWEGNKIIGETNNSLFTHFLVKGLEGEADSDGNGKITVDELYDYAFEQIVRLTPKQKPNKSATKQEGEIVLRQIMRMEDIKPVSLPDELIEAIEDSRTFVRGGAVQELEKLLKGKNLGLARSAREALEKIAASDDSYRIRHVATQVLDSIWQAEKAAKDERKVKEEAERITILRTEEERLARETAELERKAKEEAERLLAEKKPEERFLKATREAERIATEKAEQERLARQNAENEAKLKAALEEIDRKAAERTARERAEAERLAQQKAEKEDIAKARMEARDLAAEKGKTVRKTEDQRGEEKNRLRIPLRNILVRGGLLIFGVAALVALVAYNNELTSRRAFATAEARREATAEAKKQNAFAQLTVARAWPLVFADDFSADNLVWDTGNYSDTYATGNRLIIDGKFRWEVKAVQSFIGWGRVPADSTSRFYLSVEARRISGTRGTGFAYGLMFRQVDRNNFYLFMIDDNYRWHFRKWYNGESTVLESEYSDVVQSGDVNRLAIVAEGSHFILFINDQYVGEIDDDLLNSGKAAMVVDLDQAGDEAIFEFDNFELRSPDVISIGATATPTMITFPTSAPSIATPTPPFPLATDVGLKGDFSSPVSTVETFIAAGTAQDIDLLSQCFSVYAAGEFDPIRNKTLSVEELDGLRQFVEGAEITGFEINSDQTEAVVYIKFRSRDEMIHLVPTAEGWKIVDF